MIIDPPPLVAAPRSAREAAVRYAVLVSFAGEHIPTLDELVRWSGCPEGTVIRELRRWHRPLHDLLTGHTH